MCILADSTRLRCDAELFSQQFVEISKHHRAFNKSSSPKKCLCCLTLKVKHILSSERSALSALWQNLTS